MSRKKQRLRYEVHLDAPELGACQRVGTLFPHEAMTQLAPAFEYDPSWLESKNKFMLDPRLDLWRGEQHPPSGASAFGIFMDSAPDRWGRVLMERREALSAKNAIPPRKIRALQDFDFLLGVYDETRMGGLRFRLPEGPFLDDSENSVPPVTRLKELAHVSRLVDGGNENMPEYEKWLAMLIAPGSSLGGARPKANFRDEDGSLWIAKFPAKDDRYDVGAWEYLMHVLGRKAMIELPQARCHKLSNDYTTFCASRFDRAGAGRRMYASAMTLLERRDGDTGASYIELAEFISGNGAQGYIDTDLKQLFRRIVFNVLVGNRDDHLRNHGFIREPSGWRLSPAFDINPNRSKGEHAITIDGYDASPNIQAVMATAELYRLTKLEAASIKAETIKAIVDWRSDAERLGLSSLEIRQMESVIQA
ncbi:HipA domain-containing protein [Robbsia sp. KACC 23696]|uniref:type II toxin-antitoxin system HipA family toxin n=1 Tax=Robbsia sp. KACC 23696 TaxID=3149231 RepID=UPI00325A8FF7